MWTDTTRAHHPCAGLALPSDLTDAEWAVLEPHFPPPWHVGRPRKWPLRRIVEAVRYLLRGGLPWRMLPPCFPPISTVRRRFYLWRDNGLWLSSKKGISSHQLSRILEVQYKSAWFLSHRIRQAMRSGDLSPFGSNGGIVEVDETILGRIKGAPKNRAFHHKMKVLALVDRDSGKCRTMSLITSRLQP